MKNAGDPSSAYDSWHRLVGSGERACSLEDWHINALDLLGDVRGQSLLEVGCGRGQFSLMLEQIGARVTAIDFSAAAIAISAARSLELGCSAEFRVGDACALEFSDASFDVVVSCETLEHVPFPTKMIAECYRVLKPGGRLVLTTENYFNATALGWLAAWIRGEKFNSGTTPQPIEHFFLFWRTKHQLVRSGFIVKRMVGSHHVFLLLPKVNPATFVVGRFSNQVLGTIFRPFARHMAYLCIK